MRIAHKPKEIAESLATAEFRGLVHENFNGDNSTIKLPELPSELEIETSMIKQHSATITKEEKEQKAQKIEDGETLPLKKQGMILGCRTAD